MKTAFIDQKGEFQIKSIWGYQVSLLDYDIQYAYYSSPRASMP